MTYPGLFNATYIPSPYELSIIDNPGSNIGPWLVSAGVATALEASVSQVGLHEATVLTRF